MLGRVKAAYASALSCSGIQRIADTDAEKICLLHVSMHQLLSTLRLLAVSSSPWCYLLPECMEASLIRYWAIVVVIHRKVRPCMWLAWSCSTAIVSQSEANNLQALHPTLRSPMVRLPPILHTPATEPVHMQISSLSVQNLENPKLSMKHIFRTAKF